MSSSEFVLYQLTLSALAPLQALWAYAIYVEARRRGAGETGAVQVIAIVSIIGAVLALVRQAIIAVYDPLAYDRLDTTSPATPATIALILVAFAIFFCTIALYWSAAKALVQAEDMGPQYELRESLITTIWIVFPVVGIWFLGRRLSKLFARPL